MDNQINSDRVIDNNSIIIDFKYNPYDYKDLCDDMIAYYNAIILYRENKIFENKLEAHILLENLHFTLKHCELFDNIEHDLALNIRSYIWGLLGD